MAPTQSPHDELQKKQRGFGGLFVFGKIALDAALFLAAEGRIGKNEVHAVALANVGQFEAQGIAGINLRGVQTVEQEVHLTEQIGQRFRLAAKEGLVLQNLAVGHGFDLAGQVVVGLNQEPARAAGRVQNGFAQARIGHCHHEAHDSARGVELARISGGVAHFAQHRLVKRAQRLHFGTGSEMDASDFVDNIAQEIPAFHPVIDTLEHGGNDIAAGIFGRIRPGQIPQIGKEPGSLLAIGQHRLIVVDKGQKFIPSDAIGFSRPISPAIGCFDGRLEFLPRQLDLFLALNLQIIQELKEHEITLMHKVLYITFSNVVQINPESVHT